MPFGLFAKAVLLILLQGSGFFAVSQTESGSVSLVTKHVVDHDGVTSMNFINDSNLYLEGWNNLPQTQFWQQVMGLSPDSAIVNLAATRQIYETISVKAWRKLSDREKNNYRDSIRHANHLSETASIYFTIGKKDFYKFKKVMPTIDKSIAVFSENCVDPWYAQAILLIESPGKTHIKSSVGANGPFQLMKSVARMQGLTVNKYVDERTDIEKAALGASRLITRICIPKVKIMLDSVKLPYKETDLWFRLLVLHAYHAGAGNLRGVILKINPCDGGIDLMQKVWKTTYRGFQNASQNYSQLALAAFCEFDALVMQPNDSVYVIDGDKMLNSYTECAYVPYDKCSYLGDCISSYETDLIDGNIPFDYFISKINIVERELGELAPKERVFYDERYDDIGFQLLKVRNYEGAYKAFKLSETSHPNSWSAYHGLGETYRLMGENELALANYKKSLFLNPNNEDSLRGIKRLPIK